MARAELGLTRAIEREVGAERGVADGNALPHPATTALATAAAKNERRSVHGALFTKAPYRERYSAATRRRRSLTADANSRSKGSVASHPMHASVMLWP